MKNEALYHRDIELNVPSETDREVGKRMLAGARAALEGHPSVPSINVGEMRGNTNQYPKEDTQ